MVRVARADEAGNYGKLSTDNTVKAITITNNDFTFNKDTKKYNILVDEDVNDIEINVTPNDSKATVSVENNTDLKVGLNKVKVAVIAENGDKNEYLFNVYRIGEEKKEEIVPEEVKDKPKNNNIWMIVSGIELLVIIGLLLLSLKKKKNNKEDNQSNNQVTTFNNYNEEKTKEI